MRLLDTILNIVFPVNCISCGESGKELCLGCISEFPVAERESAQWIFPLYDYRHPPVKKALWLVKNKKKKRNAGVFSGIFFGEKKEQLSQLSLI